MKPNLDLSCFKNNDIRGIIGEQIDERLAYLLGRAFGEYVLAKASKTSFDELAQVVIGRDNRETSLPLQKAMTKGLIESGINVLRQATIQ